MLQVQGLDYLVGERQLLRGIDWAVQPGKRAALIGPNGAGKTTLLRLLTGELTPQSGRIVKPKSYIIGYLPQEEMNLQEGSILETALQGRRDLLDMEQRMAELHRALDGPHEYHDRLLKQLGELEERYSLEEGYRLESLAQEILTGLGFMPDDQARPLSEFSGGWRMRAYLAQLLLKHPDLLLLDEPTNHLDLPALEWLEQYLLDYKGSIVLVSHDRYFIDRLAHEIYELDRGELVKYAGDYHFYEQKKREYEELQRKKWEEQQLEIRRQERFIERFRAKNTKATQVQSRIKHLEKIERLEPPPVRRTFNFRLQAGERSFKDVLQLEGLSFRYGQDWVLRGVDLHVLRGERLALVGVNGAGKTTLARLIAGQIHPQEGRVLRGNRVRIGYYAQHQVDALDLESSLYEEVESSAADEYIPRIRNALGVFQFSGDDVYKKIKVLSGGEKARVSLAKILLSPVNFLVMDEPTNHLDVLSREALEESLRQYEGTLLLISHDRYFLDKIISRVIEVKDHNILEYAGNYSYYHEKREKTTVMESSKKGKVKTALLGKKSKEQKRQEAEARQRISKTRNTIQASIQWLEQEIDKLERRKREIEELLCRPDIYQEKDFMLSLQKELPLVNHQLQEYYADWEKARVDLEELLNSLEVIGREESPKET